MVFLSDFLELNAILIGEILVTSLVSVTPRPTNGTGEFENLSDEAEELCYSSLFLGFMKTPIWS